MSSIRKTANQDGTYTVYLGGNAIAWGLTSAAADTLIDQLGGRAPAAP